MTAMLLFLLLRVVKTTKSSQGLLKDFKRWNQKTHAKEWLIFPRT
jgi:hypothetical protein